MRAVVQRVSRAEVSVGGEKIGSIERGYLILLGVERGDEQADVDFIADKISVLRLFSGPGGEFDRNLIDVSGEILLISQFTLLGDCRRGRRPDWGAAAKSSEAEPLYSATAAALRQKNLVVREGRFGATMSVDLVNEGPVTILLDSRAKIR